MIDSINLGPATVLAQGIVTFPTTRVRSNRCNYARGGWLTHDEGSGQFDLFGGCRECGSVFEITFNANVAAPTTPGLSALVLQTNGESVGGTEMDSTSAAVNEYNNIAMTTFVRVPKGATKTITIKNLSLTESVLVKDANITIKKIA